MISWGTRTALLAAMLFVAMGVQAAEGDGVRFYSPDDLTKPENAEGEAETTRPAAAPMAASASSASAEFDPRGERACIRCHDETWPRPVLAIRNTPHGVSGDARTPFAKNDCETCHGASPDHMGAPGADDKRTPVAVGFGPKVVSDAETRNGICMQCHQGDNRQHWAGSAHESAGVACSDCHRLHVQRDPVQQRTQQAETCFKCHGTQRAQSYMPSRHDVRSGSVICAECHKPHGSTGDKLLAEISTVDTCYRCHAERRGPFLFEHPPVREDCGNCHTPHGSVNGSLLVLRPPQLCQQCHMGNSHRSPAFSGGDIASDNQGELQRMMVRGCANCHSQIHGSNHPSGSKFHR